MNIEQIRLFLKALGTVPKESSGGWVRASCPLAPWLHDNGTDSHPSFGVKIVTHGESWFHCWTCEHGDLLRLVQLLSQSGASLPKYDLKVALQLIADEGSADLAPAIKDYGDIEAKLTSDTKFDALFDELWLASFASVRKIPDGLAYLESRGISKAIAHALDLRYDTSRKTVCLPVRNYKGQLVGMRGRYTVADEWSPRFHDYANQYNQRSKYAWWGENLINFDKPVLMVEGWADIASVYRVYRNVLSPLSVGISRDKAERVAECLDIVTLFDNGAGGNKARQLIDKYFPEAIKVHLQPIVDSANPAKKTDPNDMSVNQLVDLLSPYLVLDAIIE